MPISQLRKGVIAGRSKPKKANPKRTKIRDALRQRGAMMHAMLADIGRNPVYENTPGLGVSIYEKAWSKQAKAWLDANMKRYTVA